MVADSNPWLHLNQTDAVRMTVINARGDRTAATAGETIVELPGLWLEPETPEG